VIQHEDIHWQQIKHVGFFRFYFFYVSEYFQGRFKGMNHDKAYRNISFEREAYTFQNKIGYRVSLESIKKFRSHKIS
jgi:hypothetical protein